jgi:hypothetical protein
MMLADKTHLAKSLERSPVIRGTEAHRTFRIPISLVRSSVDKVEMPINPIQAMTIESIIKEPKILPIILLFW